jgi:tetratricopeptide (TPR) repeat protein
VLNAPNGKALAARLATLQERARGYTYLGKYREAASCLHRGLRLVGSAATSPTYNHLALWNELGIVYKYLGKFKSAQKFYGIALQHSSSCLTGRDRYDFLANLYHNLGGLEHSRGQFSRGEPYARKSLQFRARAAGASSIAVAADRAALAAILDGLRKFNESQKLYRKALKTYRRVYGKSHREIALILNNLAAVYQAAGQPSRAETHYRASLAMKRQKLGKAHPDVAITMNNLAMLYASLGREPEARLWFEKALKLLRNSLGKSHPNTLAVKRNLQKVKTAYPMRAVKNRTKAW